MTSKEFYSMYLFDQYLDRVRDEVFSQHRVEQEHKGLTWSWTNRFDSAKLFDHAGFTTGSTYTYMELCNN